MEHVRWHDDSELAWIMLNCTWTDMRANRSPRVTTWSWKVKQLENMKIQSFQKIYHTFHFRDQNPEIDPWFTCAHRGLCTTNIKLKHMIWMQQVNWIENMQTKSPRKPWYLSNCFHRLWIELKCCMLRVKHLNWIGNILPNKTNRFTYSNSSRFVRFHIYLSDLNGHSTCPMRNRVLFSERTTVSTSHIKSK